MFRTKITMGASVLAVALLTAGCGGSDPVATDPGTDGGGDSPSASAPADTIVVGSANFPENVVLGNIYAEALTAAGVDVETRLNIGSREAYMPGLQDGSIDLIPEYSGVLLQYFKGPPEAVSSEDVYAALPDALPDGLIVLEQSAAEDKDAIVVTRETADKYKLTSIADLKDVAGELTFGGPPEIQERESGLPGFEAKYGVVFGSFKALDAGGPLSVNGLKNGQVDAADIFTTDPAIEANDFVVLEDPEFVFAAQNVLPLINEEKASETVTEVLNAVSAQLTTQDLIDMLTKVYNDKADPNAVAKEWLTEKGLI